MKKVTSNKDRMLQNDINNKGRLGLLGQLAFCLHLPPWQEKYTQEDRIRLSRKISKLGGIYTFSVPQMPERSKTEITTVMIIDDDLRSTAEYL